MPTPANAAKRPSVSLGSSASSGCETDPAKEATSCSKVEAAGGVWFAHMVELPLLGRDSSCSICTGVLALTVADSFADASASSDGEGFSISNFKRVAKDSLTDLCTLPLLPATSLISIENDVVGSSRLIAVCLTGGGNIIQEDEEAVHDEAPSAPQRVCSLTLTQPASQRAFNAIPDVPCTSVSTPLQVAANAAAALTAGRSREYRAATQRRCVCLLGATAFSLDIQESAPRPHPSPCQMN